MITITLIITAGIILLLRQFGIIKNPFIAFLVAAIIVVSSAFIFRNKLNCPFVKKCPFTFCPLQKTEQRNSLGNGKY